MMKSMMFALAALAAFQAAAITATKEYVDRRDTEIRTNTYTKAETDARIVELAPPGITTSDVCNIAEAVSASATNALDVSLSSLVSQSSQSSTNYTDEAIYTLEEKLTTAIIVPQTSVFSEFSLNLSSSDGEFIDNRSATEIFAQLDSAATTSYVDSATNSLSTSFAPTISNTVTKAFVESLGIESGIQEESDPVWSSEKGNYATKQNVTVVSNLAASADTKANTLISYVNGDDVMDVVTNYDSAVHISSRSLRQRVEDGGTNYWRVVWDEMIRWDWFMYTYLPTNYYNKAEVDSALDDKADRAWGFYDSHTGGWSPDGYLQISAPKILIAKDMAYQRHVTTGGAVWVLESSGLVTEVGGVASNGFFRISDDEGNALFEIVKGNKRTIGSTAGALTTTNIMGVTHLYITYAVEAAEHPTIEATTSLGTPFVSQESVSSPVNVTWTGSTGDYHAEVWPKSASSSLFVRAAHEIGGETYIKNTAPTGLDGGLIYNGVKYRVVPYSSGGKTYLTLEAW